MNRVSTKSIAQNNYKRFCALEGSDHIASEFAIETLLKIIQHFKIKKVLELGLGIGAVADTVLKYSKIYNDRIEYFGTEKNDFCLSVLPENVEHFNNLSLYNELKSIKDETFDLIIIDGLDTSLDSIKNYVNSRSILFVEGGRKLQTETLLQMFPKHYFVNVITLRKHRPYSPGGERFLNNYIGGGQLIFIYPNAKMKLFYIKEKLKSFVVLRIRRLKKNA